MRNNIIATLFFAVLILITSMTDAEEMLRISNRSVFKKISRGDVMFPHDRHYSSGIECLRCHHRFEKGTNVLTIVELQPGTQAVSCVACHISGRNLERAYHRLCITCHHDIKKTNKVSGPVMCGLCHSRKEK